MVMSCWRGQGQAMLGVMPWLLSQELVIHGKSFGKRWRILHDSQDPAVALEVPGGVWGMHTVFKKIFFYFIIFAFTHMCIHWDTNPHLPSSGQNLLCPLVLQFC
jgi:hypothetical protein